MAIKMMELESQPKKELIVTEIEVLYIILCQFKLGVVCFNILLG